MKDDELENLPPMEQSARLRARRRDIIDRLKAQPVAEVSAVVHAAGGSATNYGPIEGCERNFRFEPWKFAGGKINDSCLVLYKDFPQGDLTEEYFEVLRPFAASRVRARIGQFDGENHGLLEGVLGPETTDKELLAWAKKMHGPESFDDEFFGKFTRGFERRYQVRARWQSVEVDLVLDTGSERLDLPPLVTTARSLWAASDRWDRMIRECVMEHQAKLRKDAWIPDDEPFVSAEQINRRLSIAHINIRIINGFQWIKIGIEDGDLFGGEFIWVSGKFTEGPTGAYIISKWG